MSRSTLSLTRRTSPVYSGRFRCGEHPLLKDLREETGELPDAQMQISPDQGQFMATLLRLIQARSVLEIGTFTGYSALAMALVLPPDGHLVACDISEPYTSIAQKYWAKAGVFDRISLHLAPASTTLTGLLSSGKANTFDAAFIDADKESYDLYYEKSLALLRPGGLIMIDNVLRGGDIVNTTTKSKSTQSIQALNKKLHQDSRVHLSIVPIGDGMTLAQKI